VGKKYQNNKADTSQPTVPEQVSVALGEVGEGQLALAVGTGLRDAQRDDGSRRHHGMRGQGGRHDPMRTATRHDHETGSVSLGGRRVPGAGEPAADARANNGSGELPIATYKLFSGTEVLGRMAMQRMLARLWTRRYPLGLKPVGARVKQ
jgi:putative transposase